MTLWVYFHLFSRCCLPKCEFGPNSVTICICSSSRSSKVINSGTNGKHTYEFLLVINSVLWSYLAAFPRYGDLLAENRIFFIPLSYLACSLPMYPLEICGEVRHGKTRVMGLSCDLWWKLHDPSFNRFWLIHLCVGQTLTTAVQFDAPTPGNPGENLHTPYIFGN